MHREHATPERSAILESLRSGCYLWSRLEVVDSVKAERLKYVVVQAYLGIAIVRANPVKFAPNLPRRGIKKRFNIPLHLEMKAYCSLQTALKISLYVFNRTPACGVINLQSLSKPSISIGTDNDP